MTRLRIAALSCVLVVTAGVIWSLAASTAQATTALKLAAKPEPVEADMHEFMEYVFQPTYRRLKEAMAAAPADNKGWKAIKADALILAEGGNLTLFRGPDDNRAAWDKHCVDVREHGKALYTAARGKDYDAAKKAYTMMLNSCNACHDDFAGGEHQLTP